MTQGGKLLADVGGPYVLAPVRGVLRYHGRDRRRYVMSVQDDLGYVKLETRFIGLPLVFAARLRTLCRSPARCRVPARSIPRAGLTCWKALDYQVPLVQAEAFPAGPLRISRARAGGRALHAQLCRGQPCRRSGRLSS